MNKYRVQPASSADKREIITLLQSCHLPIEDLTHSHIDHFFVIKLGKELVGTIGLEICGSFGLLRSLAVSEPHRKQDLGIELVSQVETYAQSLNLQAIYLLTTTANLFFSKIDYQIQDRIDVPPSIQATEEFKNICPETAFCMMKRISYE